MDTALNSAPNGSANIFSVGSALLLSLGVGTSILSRNPLTQTPVPVNASPVERLEATADDGHVTPLIVRKPPGGGPFPAIVFLHRSLRERNPDRVQNIAPDLVINSRYLAEGYATVEAVYRSRGQDPQSRAPLLDCRAIVERIKAIPEVDPRSVVVLGHSGGGSLALELAGEVDLCAMVVGEPSSFLFTGMFHKDNRTRASRDKMMRDPTSFYTPELQTLTRDKIARIECPVLLVHGDQHPIYKLNSEILVPELQQSGKYVEVILYPGQPPGFVVGEESDRAATLKCFADCNAFFRKHLKTMPQPLELVQPAAMRN